MFAIQVAILRRRIGGMTEREAVRITYRELHRLKRDKDRREAIEFGQCDLGGET